MRNYGITALIVVAIVGLIAFQRVQSSREAGNFSKITAASGCGDVQVSDDLARDHQDGVRVKYKTSPPDGGPHDSRPLGAGTYDKPFSTVPEKTPSIYQAVHSLEHGYVIIWYDGLKRSQIDAIDKVTSTEREVILVPYPKLKKSQKIAMTAWGRVQYCAQAKPSAVTAFIERFRDAHSAPEYFNS